jgi:hypothetical protein
VVTANVTQAVAAGHDLNGVLAATGWSIMNYCKMRPSRLLVAGGPGGSRSTSATNLTLPAIEKKYFRAFVQYDCSRRAASAVVGAVPGRLGGTGRANLTQNSPAAIVRFMFDLYLTQPGRRKTRIDLNLMWAELESPPRVSLTRVSGAADFARRLRPWLSLGQIVARPGTLRLSRARAGAPECSGTFSIEVHSLTHSESLALN